MYMYIYNYVYVLYVFVCDNISYLIYMYTQIHTPLTVLLFAIVSL